MRSQEHARKHDREEEAEAANTRRPALPAWESFPLDDRQRLIRTILLAARHQIEERATNSRPRR